MYLRVLSVSEGTGFETARSGVNAPDFRGFLGPISGELCHAADVLVGNVENLALLWEGFLDGAGAGPDLIWPAADYGQRRPASQMSSSPDQEPFSG